MIGPGIFEPLAVLVFGSNEGQSTARMGRRQTLLDSNTTNVGKNDVDGGVSHALKFGVVFMLAHSRQQTIENVSRQRIVKDHCYAFKRNRSVSQFIPVRFENRPYEGSRPCWAMRVPSLANFRAVQCLTNGKTVKIHGTLRSDQLQDVKGEFLQTRFKIQACVVDLGEWFVRLAAQILDTADEEAAFTAKFAVDGALRSTSQLDNLIDSHALIAAL